MGIKIYKIAKSYLILNSIFYILASVGIFVAILKDVPIWLYFFTIISMLGESAGIPDRFLMVKGELFPGDNPSLPLLGIVLLIFGISGILLTKYYNTRLSKFFWYMTSVIVVITSFDNLDLGWWKTGYGGIEFYFMQLLPFVVSIFIFISAYLVFNYRSHK